MSRRSGRRRVGHGRSGFTSRHQGLSDFAATRAINAQIKFQRQWPDWTRRSRLASRRMFVLRVDSSAVLVSFAKADIATTRKSSSPKNGVDASEDAEIWASGL